MKKNWDLLLNFWQYRKSKFFLRMKISMILLLVGVMHLSANTFSQTKVSLNMKDATVQEVFSNLEKMIRKVVSEELKKAMFIPPEPAARNPETEESETDILNFLETF